MQFRDAKCLDCGHIFDVIKENYLQNWSELKFDCPKCNSQNIKVLLGKIETFDIAEGKLGNSKNSYSNGFIDHSSKFGKFKGRKFR